jgi:hypothetical protein
MAKGEYEAYKDGNKTAITGASIEATGAER